MARGNHNNVHIVHNNIDTVPNNVDIRCTLPQQQKIDFFFELYSTNTVVDYHSYSRQSSWLSSISFYNYGSTVVCKLHDISVLSYDYTVIKF